MGQGINSNSSYSREGENHLKGCRVTVKCISIIMNAQKQNANGPLHDIMY